PGAARERGSKGVISARFRVSQPRNGTFRPFSAPRVANPHGAVMMSRVSESCGPWSGRWRYNQVETTAQPAPGPEFRPRHPFSTGGGAVTNGTPAPGAVVWWRTG